MRKIDALTMAEIIAEAENRGFRSSPWQKSCRWDRGPEMAAISFLESCASDLFELIDE